jgi:hypothetical protein
MIALDPEFVGSLAPPSKLTTAIDGKPDVPFARLPRLDRLRVQGKADETEVDMNEENADDAEDGGVKANVSRAEKEKKKMRGKNKSLKRFVVTIRKESLRLKLSSSSYLRKQRKNVVDPKAVSLCLLSTIQLLLTLVDILRLLCARKWRRSERPGEKKGPSLLEPSSLTNPLYLIALDDQPDEFAACFHCSWLYLAKYVYVKLVRTTKHILCFRNDLSQL